MTLPPLGLYIHLPWCERKCPYCDFNSHETASIPEARYIATLLRDLHNDIALVQGRPIESIFIGGGTPSLFSGQAIAALLQDVARLTALSDDSEITMEANPGSAEADKFRAFREAGVNRLSLGVQSFNDDCLQALGRIHNGEEAHNAIELAQAAGFDNLNLDLMHGLPGQTSGQAVADLETAIGMNPTHLSWYQLTIEPNTVFHSRPPVLPVEDALADIQTAGEALLHTAGFAQYEVSAYSKLNRQCRHNLNYWRFGDYLGIGAGAHGKITLGDGRIMRYTKRRQPAEYMNAGDASFTASRRELTEPERLGEFAMNALRLREGFDRQLFRARTALEPAQLEKVVSSLCERGLLVQDGDRVMASDAGFRFLDSVIAEFFEDQAR